MRWERNAEFWIRIIRERLDPFRTEVTDAAVLRALGPCRGRAVLDAGCGEGYLTRRLAGRGASAVGVDRSVRLVAAGMDAPTVIWVRPLESYFALLADAGFVVEALWEPRPARRLMAEQWWRDTNFRRPLFLLLRAVSRPRRR